MIEYLKVRNRPRIFWVLALNQPDISFPLLEPSCRNDKHGHAFFKWTSILLFSEHLHEIFPLILQFPDTFLAGLILTQNRSYFFDYFMMNWTEALLVNNAVLKVLELFKNGRLQNELCLKVDDVGLEVNCRLIMADQGRHNSEALVILMSGKVRSSQI